jgi:hypothetical protein
VAAAWAAWNARAGRASDRADRPWVLPGLAPPPESVRLHDAMGVAANAYTYTGRTSGLLGHRAGKEGGQASDRASVWPESCQLDELAGSELEPYFVVSRLAFLQICFYLVGPAEIGRRKVGPRADPRSVTPPHRYPRRGQHGDLQLFRRTM